MFINRYGDVVGAEKFLKITLAQKLKCCKQYFWQAPMNVFFITKQKQIQFET